MDSSNRFIMKPKFNNLSENELNYKDILTYIAVRSFYNHTDKYCYPSYKALSELSGLSRKFISLSVKRLYKAGFFSLWKVGKRRVSHWYLFDEMVKFQRIPLSLFSAPLSVHQKSMLLVLSEYCELGICFQTITEIASSSGLSYRTIHRQYQALCLKGYILEGMYADPLEETLTKYFKFSNELKWKHQIYNRTNAEDDSSDYAEKMICIATKFFYRSRK